MIGARISSLLLLQFGSHHAYGDSPARIRIVHPHSHRCLNIATFAASGAESTIALNVDDNADYSIRKVSNKARALDVKVFRGFSISAHEYILEQHRKNGYDVSETQAIDFLMMNYDDDGNYIMHNIIEPDLYVPEIYFAAVYNGAEQEKTQLFERQNGIIGVVSAQLRRSAPITDGSSSPSEVTTATIPSPHIYVANMRVHDKMRRKGVGKALLSSVLAHTISTKDRLNETIPLVLSVENDNLGAIQLYEQFGFEYFEKNKFFSLMMLWPERVTGQ